MPNEKYYTAKYFKQRDYLDEHVAKSLLIFLRSHNYKSVLDVGCGTGLLIKFLKQHGIKSTGCDKYYHRQGIIKASATKLPFAKSQFDLLTNISVIEHLTLDEIHKFLNEAYRVIKPGGAIFIITPNFASPFRPLRGSHWFAYSDPTHLTYFTPKSLASLLINHGFQKTELRFTIDPQINFELHLPGFRRWLPRWAKHFLTYLMISSPLSTMRDSFWIAASKPI